MTQGLWLHRPRRRLRRPLRALQRNPGPGLQDPCREAARAVRSHPGPQGPAGQPDPRDL